MREPLYVAVSIDVEEEGLFRGKYKCDNTSVNNVKYLSRLTPLIERGIKPTLFCAWSVFKDANACSLLEKLLDKIEIGAHLHHWNTPPIAQNIPSSGELLSVPASQVPIPALDAKIGNLLEAGRGFTGKAITSFRMGRWDLHGDLLPLVAKHGILCDASVRPLHTHQDKDSGPDHFDAPADPYWIELEEGKLLEAPLTVTPLLAPFAHIPEHFAWGRRLRASLRHWGALALLPVQHPLWLMKLTTNLRVNGGGRFLSLTWHSSEMMPGGAPHLPDAYSVNAFLNKISRYLDWLEHNFKVTYIAMSDFRKIDNWSSAPSKHAGDWKPIKGLV